MFLDNIKHKLNNAVLNKDWDKHRFNWHLLKDGDAESQVDRVRNRICSNKLLFVQLLEHFDKSNDDFLAIRQHVIYSF